MNAWKTISISCVAVFVAGCGSSDAGSSSGGVGGGSSTVSAGNSTSQSVGAGFTSSTGSSSSSGGIGDCNGSDPQGCQCTTLGATQGCYAGPMSQAGVGACTLGTQSCVSNNDGEIVTNVWGACVGSGAPSAEVCGDGIDNDCNGVVDDNCPSCNNGDTQACTTPQGPGVMTCQSGVWSPCNVQCSDGQSQSCTTSTGETGTEVCANGVWGPCGGALPPGNVGDPCTTGTSTTPNPGSDCASSSGSPSSVLYCETGTYQCFPNSGCTYDACNDCLHMNCSQFLTATDPSCQAQLDSAWTWLIECGPDRTSYYGTLEGSCADISNLNSCKFQYCTPAIDQGPCNYY